MTADDFAVSPYFRSSLRRSSRLGRPIVTMDAFVTASAFAFAASAIRCPSASTSALIFSLAFS